MAKNYLNLSEIYSNYHAWYLTNTKLKNVFIYSLNTFAYFEKRGLKSVK